jgi:hypothetical protein
MWMLVSLARAKEHLKETGTDQDELIAIYVSAASRAVHAYIGDQAGELLSMDSPPDSPAQDLTVVDERVQAAVLMLTGYYFRNRDSNPDKEFGHGTLPFPVTAILYQLRDPPLA